MAPLRLLELRSAWGAGGGPEKTILLSAARHDRARVRPRVVYLRSPRDERFEDGVGARAREAGTRILAVPDRGRFDLACVARLRRLARGADVIHAHDYKTDVYGLLLGRGGGRAALVATAHGWTGESRLVRFYREVDLVALRFYDRVLAVSSATRRALVEGGVEPARIVLVRNAIDERAWRPGNGQGDLRVELGVGPRDPVVGTVARLSHEKGVDQFLEHAVRVDAALAAESRPRATFVVVGDGPDRASLEARAVALGIAGRVRFLGHRADVVRALNTFDAFVLPSRVENGPNALLEAMALARPCVAFDVGGMAETLGSCGRLVPGGAVAALAGEVFALLRDPEGARALGAEARARVETEFGFARRLRRVEAIYEEVVRERASPFGLQLSENPAG